MGSGKLLIFLVVWQKENPSRMDLVQFSRTKFKKHPRKYRVEQNEIKIFILLITITNDNNS